MQLKYQELATELLAKRNEIHRQKDQLCKDKAKAMEEATDRYCEAKRKGQAEIDEIRAEKHRIEFNTPQFHILEDEARSLERKLSMLRSDHEHELHTINNRFAVLRCDLDDEDRKATLWYEQQKTALMQQMVEQKQQEEETNSGKTTD